MRSHAEVVTAGADSLVRRLAADLAAAEPAGQVVEEAGWTVLRIVGGSCAVTGTGDAVILDAEAADAQTLERLQAVVGEHLERLAASEGLRVRWGAPQP